MHELFLPLSLTLGLAMWGIVGWWLLNTWLDSLAGNRALGVLVFPHIMRYIGLSFLIAGVTAQPLDPRFASPAAWGDLAAALLALVALIALARDWFLARPVTWLFSIVGTLDFAIALVQGLRFNEAAAMGATYYIPAVAVPMLLVSHALVFRQLLRSR
mgnify:FL=1